MENATQKQKIYNESRRYFSNQLKGVLDVQNQKLSTFYQNFGFPLTNKGFKNQHSVQGKRCS